MRRGRESCLLLTVKIAVILLNVCSAQQVAARQFRPAQAYHAEGYAKAFKPEDRGSSEWAIWNSDRKKVSFKNRIPDLQKPLEATEYEIERKIIECYDDGASCQFRRRCGLAPLNRLTPRGRPISYIVDGKDQEYGEWPSYVRLIFNFTLNRPQFASCGGTLVSNRHILTASHCLVSVQSPNLNDEFAIILKAKPSAIATIFGEHRTKYTEPPDEFEFNVPVKFVCLSDNYVPNFFFNDWAMIELAEPIRFNDHVQPACLPFEPIARTGDEATCYLVGDGFTGYKGGQGISPAIVQKLAVERVSCKKLNMSDLDRARECYSPVGDRKGNACQGDSGGPVLCLNEQGRWTVVGIVSFIGDRFCRALSDGTNIFAITRLRTLLGDVKTGCGAIGF